MIAFKPLYTKNKTSILKARKYCRKKDLVNGKHYAKKSKDLVLLIHQLPRSELQLPCKFSENFKRLHFFLRKQ